MTAAEKLLRRLERAQDLAAEVAQLRAEIVASKHRRRGREKRAPGVTREDRREARNERAAEIRAAVMERANGRCEWCGREGFALQWAHVIDGNGARQAHESVETTAAACSDCHLRGWHRNEMPTLRNAYEWALRLGFREAAHEIEKKIAKVEEARR